MSLTRGQLQEAIAGIGPVVEKVVTFAGGTTNDMGDFDGTGNPYTLFTVTGTCLVKLFALVETDLAGALGTVEVGTAKLTTGLLPLTTGTDLDVDEIWHDATPDSSVEASTVVAEKIVNQDIIQTVRTANITAGKIRYICMFKPLSLDGNVVAA